MGIKALGFAAALALATAANGFDVGEQDYWQCVPIARAVSGIRIFGDAWTWWDQAEGRYARGDSPRIGAVLAFKPYGAMRLGHVAAVTGVIDSRTILVTHANWSPIDGRRGQVEHNVAVVDVSSANDWSAVRVWFAPLSGLGGTAWPTHGFIYPRGTGASMALPPARYAAATRAEASPRLDYADFNEAIPGGTDGIAPEFLTPAKPSRLAYLDGVLRKLR